ncbi:MAG: VCBS domain-containing protein, partial [Pseudomonadota bacterium]|nr:VCBS domain-containing protein [Pseudomonadota bacterium]
VFEDNFENYAVGETLDGDTSQYSLAIYSEVVVFDVGDGEAEPTPAVFFDLKGATTSDAVDPATGMVSVLDPDAGEAFIVPASTVSTYGMFTIMEDGSWTYTVDTANPTIAALVSGERVTDTITISSVDGTTAEVEITISGVGGDTGGANKVAVIRDTDASDTGELRYALGDDGPLAAGRVTASVMRLDDDFESYLDGDSLDTDNPASVYNSSTSEATVETIGDVGGPGTEGNKFAEIRDTDASDTGELRYALGDDGPLAQGRFEVAIKRLDDDLGDGDAFITLFNSATNNDGAILDLRIRDDSFGLRSPSDIDTSAATVVLDQFMNVVVTWEYPEGNLEVNPLVTVEVDGVRMTTDGFTPDNNSVGGVTHIAVRFGDNSGTRPDTGVVSVDNFTIYSDTDGSTQVFMDDFESYLEGDSLDTDNAASLYNSSTSEAVVGVE